MATISHFPGAKQENGESFRKLSFKLSSSHANGVARDIAKSVTRDGRLQSYLGLGGPSWLASRIEEDQRR